MTSIPSDRNLVDVMDNNAGPVTNKGNIYYCFKISSKLNKNSKKS